MSSTEGVHSVVHAIRILEQFQNGEGLNATEISQRIGIPRATTYRILKTLILHHILIQGSDKKYRLTLRLMELGNAALAIPSLQQVVDPFLVSLVEETEETAHFSILDGYHVGYIAKKESPHPFRMLSYVGWRGPLHATASGKVLLAYSDEGVIESVLNRPLQAYTQNTITDPFTLKRELQKIRSFKFASEDEELSEGLACISVPVFLSENQIGALSVSGPKERITHKVSKEEIVNLLHQRSKSITDILNYGKK
ncbi:IclR family transcriptional regulator [Aneurinibacillus tyrosinisolvens]|uniref:IclR family transcriptional regulator n=1 Tax=Aneurinibacillus tyrosinisolvens TaxID=1443435 RepID=UPI00063F98C6|nr:IclR family transcriptional regulator [Aneurinibacillus tyrosinisolvens]